MDQKLVLIRLNRNGQIAFPIPTFMQEVSRAAPGKVMFVGSPNAEAQTVIASFKNTGIAVEVTPKLSYEEYQQLALTYNVTALVAAPPSID